jgi:hypothetical protein
MSPLSLKDWHDEPTRDTPIDRETLRDMEARLGAYTDERVATRVSLVLYADTYYNSVVYASKSAALQAGIAAVAAQGGGCLRFTDASTYTLDTAVLTIPPTVPIEIDLNGATLKLAATAPRAFDWGKTAEFQSFLPNIHGGTVDAANINGASLGLGTVTTGATLGVTTIAAGSDKKVLPQGTINVASTASFPAEGQLVIGADVVTYTGKGATEFTGCTGGTGELTTGEKVKGRKTIVLTVEAQFREGGATLYHVVTGELLNYTGTQAVGSQTWTVTAGSVAVVIGIGDKIENNCRMHVICGGYIGNQYITRINLSNPRVENMKTINVPSDNRTASPGTIRTNVDFILVNGSGTQTTVTAPRINQCKFEGGNTGAIIAGTTQGAEVTCNVYIDDWLVNDVTHDTGQVPVRFSTAANVQIGSASTGGTGTVSNIKGKNSFDVGIEIDDGVNVNNTEKCTITDARTVAYGVYTYSPSQQPLVQFSRYESCTAQLQKLKPDNKEILGYGWYLNGGRNIVLGPGCNYTIESAGDLARNQGGVGGNTASHGLALYIPPGSPVQYLDWTSLLVTIEGIAHSPTVSTTINLVLLEGTALRAVRGRGLDFHLAGTKAETAAAGASWQLVQCGGGSTSAAKGVLYNIEDVTLDWNVTNAGKGAEDAVYMGILGQRAAVATIRGRFGRWSPVQFAAGTGASFADTIFVSSTASLTLDYLLVEGCNVNAAGLTGLGNSLLISVDTTQTSKVLLRQNVAHGSAWPPPVSLMTEATVSAAATYTNTTAFAGRATIIPGGAEVAATTIAAGSNAKKLPQTEIFVASTANFPTAGNVVIGTIGALVAYTGFVANEKLTGCTVLNESTSEMLTGQTVTPMIVLSTRGATGGKSTAAYHPTAREISLDPGDSIAIPFINFPVVEFIPNK